ncbi:MAG TPA: hypothetical protein VFI34_06920 [Candidatus Limnocylindrales bacterium]|nr:hypothetical protein [Candidatus Limnocylindrales bacterium]
MTGSAADDEVQVVVAIRWLAEHGFDPWPEIAVLERAAAQAG